MTAMIMMILILMIIKGQTIDNRQNAYINQLMILIMFTRVVSHLSVAQIMKEKMMLMRITT